MTIRFQNSLVALSLAAASAFATAPAQAEVAKHANLDIQCTQDGIAYPKVIDIVSNSTGSTVTLFGQTYNDRQLVGVTEGGDPYLQAVDNTGGYNITIAGGDFQKAFEGTAVKLGSAKASVNLFKLGEQFSATCVGSYEFTPMRSALPVVPGRPIPPLTPGPPPSACVVDPVRMSTILMAATPELESIKKAHMTSATAVTCQQIAPGVVEYQFVFRTCGRCLPSSAMLKVQQDETPTYADGAPTYVKTVTTTR